MDYKISKEELGNDWLYSTLIALDKCMAVHGLPLYVVGARARDVAITRARYSVAFVLCDDICNKIKDIPIWYKEGEQT